MDEAGFLPVPASALTGLLVSAVVSGTPTVAISGTVPVNIIETIPVPVAITNDTVHVTVDNPVLPVQITNDPLPVTVDGPLAVNQYVRDIVTGDWTSAIGLNASAVGYYYGGSEHIQTYGGCVPLQAVGGFFAAATEPTTFLINTSYISAPGAANTLVVSTGVGPSESPYSGST